MLVKADEFISIPPEFLKDLESCAVYNSDVHDILAKYGFVSKKSKGGVKECTNYFKQKVAEICKYNYNPTASDTKKLKSFLNNNSVDTFKNVVDYAFENTINIKFLEGKVLTITIILVVVNDILALIHKRDSRISSNLKSEDNFRF